MSGAVTASVSMLTVVSLGLLALALLAWRRSGEARFGLLSGAFACFAAGAGTTLALLFSTADPVDLLALLAGSAAAGLSLAYFAAVKR